MAEAFIGPGDYEEDPEDPFGGLHPHCFYCRSFLFCTKDDPSNKEISCDHVRCSMNCGAVYHGCKEPEHLLLCPNLVVDCLNAQFGCPLSMARKELSKHLEKCAASVVMCMAEWNRWPLYSTERQKYVAFRQKNPYADEGQLGK